MVGKSPSAHLEYRLVPMICTSHVANLCVKTAICGQGGASKSDLICANVVRFFKYLTPNYADEYSMNIRKHVTQTLEFKIGSIGADVVPAMDKLQMLYSKIVIPDSVLQIMNSGFGVWSHTSEPGVDVDKNDVCNRLFSVLRDRIVLAEEKPIVTRFFLFSNCVHTLLMSLLLGLPVSVYCVTSSHPSEDNEKRINRFSAWYTNPETLIELKIASLCLQLTQHATSITAQKTEDKVRSFQN